jgi:hypothetical protein|tara:strand:+ start:2633 stop:3373 length:741 start_codon:yes stop_codon:yes gene_type:complete
MANAVEKVNTIEIGDIEKVNTITDDNLEDLNTLEFAGVTDAHVLLATITVPADSSSPVANMTFTGINDTYDVYEFVFTSLHPQTDNVNFVFSTNMSGDAGGDFDVNVMNSTFYQSYHKEDGSDSNLAYSSGNDVSNEDGIVFVPLLAGLQNDADSSASGVFTWYGPIGINAVVGTYGRYYGFQKQWISRFNFQNSDPHYTTDSNTAGQMGNYNTDHSWQGHTEIRFKMSSGNIDAGEVKMYGLAIA